MKPKLQTQYKSRRETDPAVIRQAVMKLVNQRTFGGGELDFPCIPSLTDAYVAKLAGLWATLARPASNEELAQLRMTVNQALTSGYQQSPFARMVVTYAALPPPAQGVRYTIAVNLVSLADHYASWITNRQPPLFGKHADAKILALAAALGNPSESPILDVGAGTGRNAVPLAKLGHPMDAVEPVPEFVQQMTAAARSSHVSINVMAEDVLSPDLILKRDHYKLIFLSEVITHFTRVVDVRTALAKLADALSPGGFLAFNAFLAVAGYKPDITVREVSHTAWSCVFTRTDMAFLTQELALESVSDANAHDYEKEHLPPDAWPPTQWFVDWSHGRNILDLPIGRSPIELCWLVYRKR
jgi:2-polyprenyl-3-methyl-5-hydroxy-6-metoxy-1,4-benzoquinol methylase